MSKPKKPREVKAPAKIAPGPRNQKAMDQAVGKYGARPVPVAIKWETIGDTGQFFGASPHSDSVGHAIQLAATFGTTSTTFTVANLTALEWATRTRGQQQGQSDTEINAGLALINAIDPADELEAALAVEMASCHALSMDMLGRAKNTDRVDHLQLYGNMAVKLQRTFTAQIEALARLRGKGQQTVRVEHVTVHPGAQAIVGDVHHHAPGAPGAKAGNEDRPHGTTAAAPGAQASTALPSPDPLGNGVPIPGDAKRALPAPRRTVARRPRQSERLQARQLEPGDDRDAARAEDDAS